jgi:hypothetical protein
MGHVATIACELKIFASRRRRRLLCLALLMAVVVLPVSIIASHPPLARVLSASALEWIFLEMGFLCWAITVRTKRRRILGRITLAVAVLAWASGLIIVFLPDPPPGSARIWNEMWYVLSWAATYALVGITLALVPRVTRGFRVAQWSLVGLFAMVMGVYATYMIVAMLVSPSPFYFGVWPVVGMLHIGIGVVTPVVIFGWLWFETPEVVPDAKGEVRLDCPRCGLSQEVRTGYSRCRACELGFKIEVEERRCKSCRYLLRGLTRPICPECGTVFREEELVRPEGVAAAPVQPQL